MPKSAFPAPLRSVLVATDFSKGSTWALDRALQLPLAPRAKIHVVHVLTGGFAETLLPGARAAARSALATAVEEAGRRAASRGLRLTTEIREREAFVEIIRSARAREAELVVVGRHGRRTIRDMFLGSTAARVLRNGDVPVLVVRLEPHRAYARPLLATDLSDTSRRTCDLLLRVVGPSVRSIRAVHAFNVPFEGFVTPAFGFGVESKYRREFRAKATKLLDTFLRNYGAVPRSRFRAVVRSGDARSAVLTEAQRCHADLIALGTHGRSGLAHALIGSVAEWIVAAAPCDVLVSRPVRFTFELP